MATEITSKGQLQAMARKLTSISAQLVSEASNIIGMLSEVEDIDGINISQAATAIQNNLKNVSGEMESLASGFSNYANDIENFDTYELQADETKQNDTSQRPTNKDSNSTKDNIDEQASSPATQPTTTKTNNTPSSSSPSNDNHEANNNSENELKSEETIKITQGDLNYDLEDRYHQYVESIFEMTTGNLAYEISEEDFDLLCAIVTAESNESYDGSLAVISTILNRCEQPNYVASYGTNPISQATASNQFMGYCNNEYKQYINGNYPETVVQAVTDALAGVRNHKICNFSENNMVTL